MKKPMSKKLHYWWLSEIDNDYNNCRNNTLAMLYIEVATLTMKTSEIIEKGIGEIAWEMNKMIGSWTREKIETTLDRWVANPTFRRMSDLASLTTMVASNSPRFNVYGNDFGWGRPVAVRSGSSGKCDGRMILYPGPESGSIEVHACLLPQTLLDMEKDDEFMNEVTL